VPLPLDTSKQSVAAGADKETYSNQEHTRNKILFQLKVDHPRTG